MSKRQATKKEHWLPQASHLAQFTQHGKANVYRFVAGDKVQFVATAKHFKSSTKNIGHEIDLYERDDLPVNAVEDALAEIEGKFGKVLEDKIKLHKPLSPREREVVAQYVVLLQHRTPQQRDHLIRTMDQIDSMGKQMALAHGHPEASNKMSADIDNYKKMIFTDAMAIAQDVNTWGQLDYCFVIIPDYMEDAEFITGDNPVSLVDFTQSGANSVYGSRPWNKTAESVVPLTPKIALFGNRAGITGYRQIDYNYLREINSRTLAHSSQMVIARNEISEEENSAMVKRYPQSLILEFVRLPAGRADRLLSKIKKQEAANSLSATDLYQPDGSQLQRPEETSEQSKG